MPGRPPGPLIHALRGDRGLARATFGEFRHMPGTVEVGPRWAPLLTHIGIVAVLLDDAGTAERVYRELSGLAPGYMGDGSGAVFCGGSTERIAGDLTLATGRVDEAIRRYTDAIDMNARIGARPFLALSRLGLAKALVAKGHPGDLPSARTLAAEAAAESRRIGLPGPRAAADALLARIDAETRALNPLSPRECEVAGSALGAAVTSLARTSRAVQNGLICVIPGSLAREPLGRFRLSQSLLELGDCLAQGGNLGREGGDRFGLPLPVFFLVGLDKPGGCRGGGDAEYAHPGDHEHDPDRAPSGGHWVVVAIPDGRHR